MTIKKVLAKEIGSLLSKAAAAGVVGSLFGSHHAEDPASSSTSSAWKEIEQKLQGLFSHHDEADRKARADKKRRAGISVAVAVVVVFLLGRRSGRQTTSILEVHRS